MLSFAMKPLEDEPLVDMRGAHTLCAVDIPELRSSSASEQRIDHAWRRQEACDSPLCLFVPELTRDALRLQEQRAGRLHLTKEQVESRASARLDLSSEVTRSAKSALLVVAIAIINVDVQPSPADLLLSGRSESSKCPAFRPRQILHGVSIIGQRLPSAHHRTHSPSPPPKLPQVPVKHLGRILLAGLTAVRL